MLENLKRVRNSPIFLTGHTGFKGTWLTLLLEKLGFATAGFSLAPEIDSLFNRLGQLSLERNYSADIRDMTELSEAIENTRPEVVIHFAAQSLVLASYEKPRETFEINTLGTFNLLEAASACPSVKTILVITTDKVYLNKNDGKRFREDDCLGGSDPYSGSKVAAESICKTWQKINTLNQGPKVIVARAGNVIGGGDYSKNRLIPDLIRGHQSNSVIQIRNPSATRPWQHVLDPLMGYLRYLDKALDGDVSNALNFGPVEPSKHVSDVIEIAQDILDLNCDIRVEEEQSALEARTLDLDSSRANEQLGWEPVWSQSEAIERTFRWWKEVLTGHTNARDACSKDIDDFLSFR